MKTWPDHGLREAKKLQGIPSTAFLDPDGVVLIKVRYDRRRSVAGIAKAGERAKRYIELRTKSVSDDKARIAFFIMQLEERQLDLKTATKTYAALKDLPGEQRELLDTHLLDLRISTELRANGQAGRKTLGEAYWNMWRKGPRPSVKVSRGYWYAILEWAKHERDLEVFEQAIEAFGAQLEITDKGEAWVAPLLARYKKQLAELRR